MVACKTTLKEQKYWGPITCVICFFTGCWCLYFCPLDTRFIEVCKSDTGERGTGEMLKLERRMSGSDMLRV